MLLKVNPKSSIEAIAMPALTWIKLWGIRPKKEASVNVFNGTPIIGEDIAVSHLGTNGATLKDNK